jgi:hypothetical protein
VGKSARDSSKERVAVAGTEKKRKAGEKLRVKVQGVWPFTKYQAREGSKNTAAISRRLISGLIISVRQQ